MPSRLLPLGVVRLLHVDDAPEDLAALRRFTNSKDLRFAIDGAGTLAEARVCLERNEYDVVLADYYLPDGLGVELTTEETGLPLIVVTGATDQEIPIAALRAGAWDFIVKDVSNEYLSLVPPTVEKVVRRLVAEREVARMKRIEEAYGDLDRFASVVGNALRFPLDDALHYLAICSAQAGTDRVLNSCVRATTQNVQRARNVLTRLLEYARAMVNMRPRVLQLEPILREVAGSLAKSLDRAGVEVQLEGHLPAALGDQTGLAWVFHELISNALTHGGSSLSKIVIEGESKGRVATLRILDDGAGPPEGLGDQLFDLFVRGDAGGNRAGVGLAICRRIIGRLGGRITSDVKQASGFGVVIELTVGPRGSEP